MSAFRRPVYFNPEAKLWTTASSSDLRVEKFHRQLPGYEQTRLVRLDALAHELGVRAVYLKDESSRFSLPSFKILGASWATFLAICHELNLAEDTTDIASLKQALNACPEPEVTLFAATDGNHGRAVARMGAILSIPVEIYVPSTMHDTTIKLIEGEGATVTISAGSYDDAVSEAYRRSQQQRGGVFVQDYAFEGYEDVPQWIVQGYLTMMREIDSQLQNEHADLVVTPVGVGCLAQAVVSHYKRESANTSTILTVEPDTAACLWKSLTRNEFRSEETTHTIMAGLDCGTVSSISWPLLQAGVDASLTISDYESHQASLYLKRLGVSSGPCGAASLAAVRRLSVADKVALGLTQDSVIVLLSTEGVREYDVPLDVSVDDPITLTQSLVRINSANPMLGSIPGPGETAIARFIAAWLEHRDIDTFWVEPVKGRPSVVGLVKGSGGGKSLMFNGHSDTVTNQGYEADKSLSGDLINGKIHGRGAADMKGGVATAMVALVNAKGLGLRGDVIFAGVADEEANSIGTEQVLKAGWRADAAIVNEPTNLDIVNAHKGFVWLEVDIHGIATHGSRADLGVDAISKAGYFLVELDRYAQRLRKAAATETPKTGPGSVHSSTIKGGEEASSYPALCTVVVERRTSSGETAEAVKQEIQSLLDKLVNEVPDFRYDLRVTLHHSPFDISRDHPFCSLVGDVISRSLGTKTVFRGEPFWTDCALLADEGIPGVLWGPRGEGLHASAEWVEAESVKQVTQGLTDIARRFCS